MMPRSINRVLASNQIIARQSSQTNYRNQYDDTIKYTYLGMGVVNGRRFARCMAVASSGEQVKVLKSLSAAQNFINKIRKEQTIFFEV